MWDKRCKNKKGCHTDSPTGFSKFLSFLREIEPLLRFTEVIVVSVVTISIAYNANRIAEKELRVEKAALQPKFEVSEYLESSAPSEDVKVNSVLTISNLGEHFNNLEFETICILEFHSIDDLVSENFKLDGFYYVHQWTGNNTGLICTSTASHNWEKYCQFAQEVLDSSIGYTDLKKFLKLSYEDQLGENHLQYYEINSIYSRLLNEYEGNLIFEEYKGLERNLDIDHLTLDYLTRVPESNG